MRPYLEKTHHKKRAGEVAQGVGPEFKPQYYKKKDNISKYEIFPKLMYNFYQNYSFLFCIIEKLILKFKCIGRGSK
jgi:hypothetical protein